MHSVWSLLTEKEIEKLSRVDRKELVQFENIIRLLKRRRDEKEREKWRAFLGSGKKDILFAQQILSFRHNQ